VNLTTPAELLSAEAFDNGLRLSTTKAPFEEFLPAFINPVHASKSKQWVTRLKATVLKLGTLYGVSTLQEASLSVFPKLINTMLVDIMSPETSKSAAIAYFEALLSFWRTFHFLLTSDKLMASQCRERLNSFVNDVKQRYKSATPDVGALFAMYASCPGGAPAFKDFIAAYVDEAFLRSSMYWTRQRVPLQSEPVFKATEIGRNIGMFQSLFVRRLIGPDPTATATLMDTSNGKLPAKLEELQGMWRKHLAETNTWPLYFRRLGLDGAVGKPMCADIPGWLRKCVERAEARGPAYGGGGGRGNNGGGYRSGNGYRGGNGGQQRHGGYRNNRNGGGYRGGGGYGGGRR